MKEQQGLIPFLIQISEDKDAKARWEASRDSCIADSDLHPDLVDVLRRCDPDEIRRRIQEEDPRAVIGEVRIDDSMFASFVTVSFVTVSFVTVSLAEDT